MVYMVDISIVALRVRKLGQKLESIKSIPLL